MIDTTYRVQQTPTGRWTSLRVISDGKPILLPDTVTTMTSNHPDDQIATLRRYFDNGFLPVGKIEVLL